jgi:hypothetical protein
VRPLRESLAEGDVLAGHLVDQDDEIVRSQADFLHDEPVQRGEQREALILRATRDKSQLEEDETLTVRAADEGGRVDELSFRKNVRDAELVLRRDREHFLECGLHGRPDRGKLAIPKRTFVHMDLSYGHIKNLLRLWEFSRNRRRARLCGKSRRLLARSIFASPDRRGARTTPFRDP